MRSGRGASQWQKRPASSTSLMVGLPVGSPVHGVNRQKTDPRNKRPVERGPARRGPGPRPPARFTIIYRPHPLTYLSIRINEYVDLLEPVRGRGPDPQPTAPAARTSRADSRGVVCRNAAPAVDDQPAPEGPGRRRVAGGAGGRREPVLRPTPRVGGAGRTPGGAGRPEARPGG